jgi:hypothetical protein
MREEKGVSDSIDMNEPVRGKPYLDMDRVFQKVENPNYRKQDKSSQNKQ